MGLLLQDESFLGPHDVQWEGEWPGHLSAIQHRDVWIL